MERKFFWFLAAISNVFLTHIHIHILPEISFLTVRKSIALCGCGELLSIANERQDPSFFMTFPTPP